MKLAYGLVCSFLLGTLICACGIEPRQNIPNANKEGKADDQSNGMSVKRVYNNKAVDMKVATDGQSIAVGNYKGEIEFDGIKLTTQKDGNNAFIVKYDADGKVLWAKNILAAQAVEINAMDWGQDGIFVTGIYVQPSSKGFVALLDDMGVEKWRTEFDGIGLDVAVDEHHFVYVVGTFLNGAVFGAKTITTKYNVGSFLAQIYTTDGAYRTVDSLEDAKGSTSTQIPIGAIATNVAAFTGNRDTVVFVAGHFDAASQSSTANIDSFVSSFVFDSDNHISGYYIKTTTMVGPGLDIIKDIAVQKEGYYNYNTYITGTFEQQLTFEGHPWAGKNTNTNITIVAQNQNAKENLFVAKLRRGSSFALWATAINGTGYSSGNSISFDHFGDVIVTGSFTDQITFKNTTLTAQSNANPDTFVAIFGHGGGTPLWAIGNQYGKGVAIDVDAKGIARVIGLSQSPTNCNSQQSSSLPCELADFVMWKQSLPCANRPTSEQITTKDQIWTKLWAVADVGGNDGPAIGFFCPMTFDANEIIAQLKNSDLTFGACQAHDYSTSNADAILHYNAFIRNQIPVIENTPGQKCEWEDMYGLTCNEMINYLADVTTLLEDPTNPGVFSSEYVHNSIDSIYVEGCLFFDYYAYRSDGIWFKFPFNFTD